MTVNEYNPDDIDAFMALLERKRWTLWWWGFMLSCVPYRAADLARWATRPIRRVMCAIQHDECPHI